MIPWGYNGDMNLAQLHISWGSNGINYDIPMGGITHR